jgi:hypothetical protein
MSTALMLCGNPGATVDGTGFTYHSSLDRTCLPLLIITEGQAMLVSEG